MKNLLTFACILALVSKGYALKCQKCTSDTENTCTGPAEDCVAPFDACISRYTATVSGNEFLRSCAKSSDCNVMYSMNVISLTTRRSSTCCQSDSCTPVAPVLPSVNTRPNGLSCDSCLMMFTNAEMCENMMTLKCTGAENTCMRYIERTHDGNTIMRGCATKSVCAVSFENVTITCTSKEFSAGGQTEGNAATQPEYGLFLLTAAGIFLLRIF